MYLILLGLLFVSYLLFNILLFNILLFNILFYNKLLSKNRKYIHITNKIYAIFDYDYCFISNKINGFDMNFQLKFNNCIYKFYNDYNRTNISKYNTCTYESPKDKEITINNTDFVNILGYYNNSTDCKEYKQINMITNNIEDINIKKIKFSYEKKYKITDINIKDYVVDFIDYNFKLYENFINKFNNPDISIIKIGTYGPSGTGKTYFLKNIRKILIKNDDSNLHGYMRILNIDLYNSFKYYYNKYKNTTTNKYKYELNKYLNDCFGYEYVIYYIDFNCTDYFLKTMIDDIFEIINSKKNLLDLKLILLCESFEYTNIYDNFDIIYKGDYINKYEMNDIIKNIDNKLNCKIKKNTLNNDKLTINEIVSQYFNND